MARLVTFLKAVLPLAIVCFFFWMLSQQRGPDPLTSIGVSVASAVVLWFGWRSVRRNVLTRWVAIVLAAYLALVLGLFAIGMAIRVALFLFVALLIAVPVIAYDLLFRAPFKGRFQRARAERRHLRQS
jgi:preprotein translocase subunit SecG